MIRFDAFISFFIPFTCLSAYFLSNFTLTLLNFYDKCFFWKEPWNVFWAHFFSLFLTRMKQTNINQQSKVQNNAWLFFSKMCHNFNMHVCHFVCLWSWVDTTIRIKTKILLWLLYSHAVYVHQRQHKNEKILLYFCCFWRVSTWILNK